MYTRAKTITNAYTHKLVHICSQRRVARQAARDFKKDSKHAKHIDYEDFKFVPALETGVDGGVRVVCCS